MRISDSRTAGPTGRRARRLAAIAAVTVAGAAVAAATLPSAFAGGSRSVVSHEDSRPVSVEVVAPHHGDNAGVSGAGWFVDLDLEYPGGPDGLTKAGFSGLQLTGPAGHNNTAPFPGTFSTGRDDRLPGLVVLTSTTNSTLPGFSGPGTNLANLFNLTGVTNRTADKTEIWDTWIVGAPIAGKDVDTTLTVAVVDDLDRNGIYDDAPAVVSDLNGDGVVDARDLRKLGVASNIKTVRFHLNGAPA